MEGKVYYYISPRRIFELAENYGLEFIYPYVKKLSGSPLWEIRILGKNNIRILYISNSGNTIVALHGFIKKTQKTPIKEMETALNRLKLWKNS